MDLTYMQIIDYMKCPMLYYFNHEVDVDGRKSDWKIYHDTIVSATMYFYHNLLNGTPPAKQDMLIRWERSWKGVEADMKEYIFLETSQHDKAPRSVDGIKALSVFYDSEMNYEFTPIVVNTETRIKCGNHFMIDSFDLVREVSETKRRKRIEIVRILSQNMNMNNWQLQSDLRTVFQVRAFRELFEAKEDRVLVYNVKKGKKEYVSISDNDIKRFNYTVDKIGDSIQNRAFYPATTAACKTCRVNASCLNYKY